MFKPISLQRVQYAMNMATNIVNQQESDVAKRNGTEGAPQQSYAERTQSIVELASLLLTEDDRQQRSIIIPGKA